MDETALSKLTEIGYCLDSIFYILMIFLVVFVFKFIMRFLNWLIH